MASYKIVGILRRLILTLMASLLLVGIALPFVGGCGVSCSKSCAMHVAQKLAAESKPTKSCCKSSLSAPKPGNPMVGKCCCQLVPNLAPDANKPTSAVTSTSADVVLTPSVTILFNPDPISECTNPIESGSERGPPDSHFPACGLRAPPLSRS